MSTNTMQYTLIVERGDTSYDAYVSDLPVCMAARETKEETLQLIKEAMEFHLEGLKEEGKRIPEPHSSREIVLVNTA